MFDVNVLGVKYSVVFATNDDDKAIKDCDGYCDTSTKTITIKKMKDEEKENPFCVKDLRAYTGKVLRHELLHAILYESGLSCNSDWALTEEMIDWFAIQFEKIANIYSDAVTNLGKEEI